MKVKQTTLIPTKYSILKEEIFKQRSYWENMNKIELEKFKEKIFIYFREHGFPHYKYTRYQKLKEFQKLQKFNCNSLLNRNHITQVMHGLGLLWSYFPHSWEIPCGNNEKVPMDYFREDDLFRKTIDKIIQLRPNLSNAALRKTLKIVNGIQMVSNFRPTAACCIYNLYGKNGTTWDMSGGFGGRLLGFLLSNNIKKYICTEPSSKTYRGLLQIKKEFGHIKKEVEIIKIGSEDYIPEENSLDLCFTSPPYFDTERYSMESTQSYLKFPTKEEWIEGFLMKTVMNCKIGLKKDGHMIINIANVKNYSTLCHDFLSKMKKIKEFIFEKELKYDLSKLMKRENSPDFKAEPIYIFRRI